MADDAADVASGPERVEGTSTTSDGPPLPERLPGDVDPPAGPRVPRRSAGIALGLVGLLAVLAVEIRFIAKESIRSPGAASSGSAAATPPVESQNRAAASPPSLAATAVMTKVPTPDYGADDIDDEPKPTKPEKPKRFGTVEEASVGSCSTASVDGLSRQIIEQVRCINSRALVPVPARPNLVLDAHTFPYLESSARDHFLRVLDGHRGQTMKVHSALRTVAQQYLVWRWAGGKRCGVQMATPPGDSNHETGRALDIAEEARWRPALEAEGFHWLGATDNVHFDFGAKGSEHTPQHGLDVLAFQRLWNRNHPDDAIPDNGRYSPLTEQRLRKSPAIGFRVGPSCAKRMPQKTDNPRSHQSP